MDKSESRDELFSIITKTRDELDLKRIREITKIGTWYLDLKSNEVTWTKELYDIFGFDSSKPPPPYTEHKRLFTPDSWEELSRSLDHTVKNGDPYELELQTVDKHKSIGWIWVRGEAIKNKDQKIIGIWGAAQNITARKNRQIELQKLQQAIVQSPSILVITDTEGNIEFANPKFTEITGYALKEVIGKPSSILKTDLYTKENYTKLWRKIKSGKIWRGEFHNRRKDGSDYWEFAIIAPVFSDDGKIQSYIKVAEDITLRKQNDQKIQKAFKDSREKERLLNITGEIASVGGWQFDIINKELSWTKGVYDIHDLPYDHKPSVQKAISFYDENSKTVIDQAFNKAIEKGVSYDLELNIVTAKGETKKIRTIGRPEIDNNGLVHSIYGTFQDVTKTRKQEQEFHKSQEELKRTFDLVPIIIATASSKSKRFVRVNQAVTKILGYTEQEFTSFQIKDIIHPDDIESSRKHLIDQIGGKLLQGFENRYLCKNGTYKWMSWRGTPIDVDGNVIVVGTDIHERKLAEERIFRLESLKSNTEKAASIGSWEFDVETLEQTWTEGIFDILEYDNLDVTPRVPQGLDFIVPPYRQIAEEAVTRAMTHGEPYNQEWQVVTQKGNLKWVRAISTAVKRDGKVLKIRGSFQDITNRKEYEIKLLEAQHLLEKAQEIGKLGTWTLDLKNNLLSWTDENYKIFGIAPGTALTYDDFIEVVHPDDRSFVNEEWTEKLKTNDYDIEHRLLVDGKVKWVREKAEITFNAIGEPIFAIGFTQDITDQIKSKQEIEAQSLAIRGYYEDLSKAQRDLMDFSNIIFNSLNEVYIFNAESLKFLYVNNGAIQNLGYTQEELLDMTPLDIKPEFSKFQFNQLIYRLKNKEIETLRFETTHQRKDKSNYSVFVTLEMTKYLDQEVYIAFILDITDKKQKEIELIYAKQKAEESDRLKSAFLANMSHEIRTPMNGILGFTELLADPETEKEERLKYAEIIDQNGERLLHLMNNLIDLSRLEAGQMMVVKSHVDLSNVFNNVKTLFAKEIEEKELEAQYLFKLKQPHIYTDKHFLEAILINLIKNAIKFTEAGTIIIQLESINNQLVCSVRDTGIGIKKEKIDSIFERFAQEDVSLTRRYDGAGLGLAICKSYVELLGGEIWAESEYGKGSCFYFSVPMS